MARTAQPSKLQDVAHAVTGSGTNTVTLTAPATTSMVLALCSAVGTSPTLAPPAGFTQGIKSEQAGFAVYAFYRAGDGSTTSYAFTTGGTVSASVCEMFELDGTQLSPGNSVASAVSSTASTTWTSNSFSTAAAGSVVFTLFLDTSGGVTTLTVGTSTQPTNLNEMTIGHSTNGSTIMTMGTEFDTTPGPVNATYTTTMASTASHTYASLSVAILPMLITELQLPGGAWPTTRTIISIAPQQAFNVIEAEVSVATGKTTKVYVTGGTTPYTATTLSGAIATATIAGGIMTITGVGPGTTTAIITDALGNTLNTVTIDVTGLSFTPAELAFANAGSPAQTSTVSGGTSPYTVLTSDATIATASIAGSTITVTPVAPGACYITVTDSTTVPLTGVIPVSVGGVGATSGQLWPLWGP